ncbi:hypothetical protein Leryth_019554 [Lithospermum erythrorhizon]|nr:hypothetical protein Leryth_019554 [Lithospermum erythrorhizon]
MAVTKMNNKKKQQSYISISSPMIESLLSSPKKKTPSSSRLKLLLKNPRFWLFLIVIFCFLAMLRMFSSFDNLFMPFSKTPCGGTKEDVFSLNGEARFQQTSLAAVNMKMVGDKGDIDVESSFWKQPDGLGYRPCLVFSEEYRNQSDVIVKERTKYLMVVVSGGMNQQRNQIVDAVVIARILGAALVVPSLQVNVIWGDESLVLRIVLLVVPFSEFSDIFDLDHFKKVLENDVRIVSSLPSTHLMTRPVEEKHVPMRREGVLLLRGLDSRLSKDLPSDLQKLRCKVAFHALRFAPPIFKLGNKLTERMRSKGPYLALHLRMEKDVWVRTGCLPGLSPEFDEMIINERKQRPELLTSRSNRTFHERKLAGLCPLNAMEVARKSTGGKDALKLLIRISLSFTTKKICPRGASEPFKQEISENSNVFMPSHGGNMGRTLQGHRAYAGHKKTITPNKRQMLPHFLNSSLSETEFSKIIMDLHQESMGQPELRTSKAGRMHYPIFHPAERIGQLLEGDYFT